MMESTDFVKADSRNLPVVDSFIMAAYFNALHGSSLEVRGVKTVLAHAGLKTPICLLFSGGGGTFTYKNIYAEWGPPLRPGEPWFVTWGPDSPYRVLIRLEGPWYVPRDPIRHAGP